MAKNEVAKVEEFEVVQLGADMAEMVARSDMKEMLAEEMAGLGDISFDRVKFPASGGITFELPGEDEEHPVPSSEIVGIIVDHHPVNAYWAEAYGSGSIGFPECTSMDGSHGSSGRACATCPHNQFGTAEKGQGKACRNMHRLYILQSGEVIPIVLAVPPTGIRALRDYIGKKLLLRGLQPHKVVTKIALKKDKTKDGSDISKPVFTCLQILSPEQVEMAAGARALCQKMRQQVDISSDDYVPSEGNGPAQAAPAAPVDADGFMDIPDGIEEDLPFN